MRHQVKLNLIHLVEECITLEKSMTSNKFTSLARKVEALELKKSGQLKYVQDMCVKFVKPMNTQPMTVQLCLLSRNASMNKLML